MYNKIMEIYDWIRASCPTFIDVVSTVIVCMLLVISIGMFCIIIVLLLKWHVLTAIVISLFLSLLVWLFNIKNHYSGGIREWWSLRPWRKNV